MLLIGKTEPSASVAGDGRRGVHFHFPLWEDVAKFLPSSHGKEKPRLPRNFHDRSRGKVPAGGGSHALVTGIDSGFLLLFPNVKKCGNMRYLALTPARMTTNLQIHLRAAGTEDIKRYTARSSGWAGRRAIKWTARARAFLWIT